MRQKKLLFSFGIIHLIVFIVLLAIIYQSDLRMQELKYDMELLRNDQARINASVVEMQGIVSSIDLDSRVQHDLLDPSQNLYDLGTRLEALELSLLEIQNTIGTSDDRLTSIESSFNELHEMLTNGVGNELSPIYQDGYYVYTSTPNIGYMTPIIALKFKNEIPKNIRIFQTLDGNELKVMYSKSGFIEPLFGYMKLSESDYEPGLYDSIIAEQEDCLLAKLEYTTGISEEIQPNMYEFLDYLDNIHDVELRSVKFSNFDQ